jgi:tetratricopeptide (TPR) repeat protein
MKKYLILWGLFLSSILTAQSGYGELITRAETAFNEGQYGKAANLYQEAAVRGGVNGALYYNQGNSWYMAGEINLALLSYLKAEVLNPGDGDIKKNLSFIRAQVGENLSENGGDEFLRVLFFWHFDISSRIRLVLFLGLNGLFWGSLIVRSLLKGRGKGFFRISLPFLGAVVLALAISLSIEYYQIRNHPHGVILTESIARKGDGLNFEEAFNRPLLGGTEFTLKEARGNWYHIELNDNTDGWIPESSAGLVQFP